MHGNVQRIQMMARGAHRIFVMSTSPRWSDLESQISHQ